MSYTCHIVCGSRRIRSYSRPGCGGESRNAVLPRLWPLAAGSVKYPMCSYQTPPQNVKTAFTISAATQAVAHCQITIPAAYFVPSSRRTEAMAATQGVYSRENTSMEAAAAGTRNAETLLPNRISMVDTTLSLAMKPEIRDVAMRQSLSTSG